MKIVKNTLKWFTAIALTLALPVVPTWADPPTMPADKLVTSPTNSGNPVARGIPDLQPYWSFDPPKHPLFDLKNITISGDMRVRPELRNNASFGVATGNGAGRLTTANDMFVQQWMRFGINYAISPDVDVFFQPQWAKNWGAANNTGVGAGCQAGICANDPFNVGQGDSLFARQAFLMIRNLGIDGLSLKAGRQMIVMGNQRLFGSFDWANTGFSHDGITMQYGQPTWELWGGWLRPLETDFNITSAGTANQNSSSFGVVPQGVGGQGTFDANLFFARLAWKPITGLSLEPLWVYFRNTNFATGNPAGTPNVGGNLTQTAHANGQNRHNVGARAAYRQGPFDGTFEGYYQFGAMSSPQNPGNQDLRINAYALAAEGGVTLPVPWSPRIGGEFNYASGDGDANNCNRVNTGGVLQNTAASCHGHANTFENFYPTNHILMGYADLAAWRNMVAYSGSLQIKPFDYQPNHLEFRFWLMRKANHGDCWYRAAQNCMFSQGVTGAVPSATSSSMYREVDGIYTLFFKNNKVAWQVGGSYLWAGQFLDQIAQAGTAATVNGSMASSAVNQIWAYTQLHVNF